MSLYIKEFLDIFKFIDKGSITKINMWNHRRCFKTRTRMSRAVEFQLVPYLRLLPGTCLTGGASGASSCASVQCSAGSGHRRPRQLRSTVLGHCTPRIMLSVITHRSVWMPLHLFCSSCPAAPEFRKTFSSVQVPPLRTGHTK
jgi:hypothetical protein